MYSMLNQANERRLYKHSNEPSLQPIGEAATYTFQTIEEHVTHKC